MSQKTYHFPVRGGIKEIHHAGYEPSYSWKCNFPIANPNKFGVSILCYSVVWTETGAFKISFQENSVTPASPLMLEQCLTSSFPHRALLSSWKLLSIGTFLPLSDTKKCGGSLKLSTLIPGHWIWKPSWIASSQKVLRSFWSTVWEIELQLSLAVITKCSETSFLAQSRLHFSAL